MYQQIRRQTFPRGKTLPLSNFIRHTHTHRDMRACTRIYMYVYILFYFISFEQQKWYGWLNVRTKINSNAFAIIQWIVVTTNEIIIDRLTPLLFYLFVINHIRIDLINLFLCLSLSHSLFFFSFLLYINDQSENI